MKIKNIDHFVITARDVATTVAFYERVLGMTAITFGDNRKALTFGSQKINLHQAGAELDPKADRPTPGSADFCLISETPIPDVMAHLKSCGVTLELEPSGRTGATGPITSVYFRDPDNNLIEVSTYD